MLQLDGPLLAAVTACLPANVGLKTVGISVGAPGTWAAPGRPLLIRRWVDGPRG
ncbi:hypothetical protein [Microbispora sp. CA-102843]|uniref:hypothetical protein n=1 Tax=Microbispora sp. CA-102843 TaxID=3239952 RepID=UPI003D8FE46F